MRIARIAFYTYITQMGNIKNIEPKIQTVKHVEMLRVARITDYNGSTKMAKTAPKTIPNEAPREERCTQQTKINAVEWERLHDLAVRFQKVVVERNARLGIKERGDVENPELVHAGLIALENVKSDEDFYRFIIDGRNRR